MRGSTPAVGVVRGSVLGMVSGFLTRPCCALPAALSLGGGGSAGLAEALAQYRLVFLSASVLLVGLSLWINIRLQTRPLNRWLAALSTLLAFGVATGLLGWSKLLY